MHPTLGITGSERVDQKRIMDEKLSARMKRKEVTGSRRRSRQSDDVRDLLMREGLNISEDGNWQWMCSWN